MFENIGAGEILLILLVVLIFFGPKKIPELANSLGKGLRKFNEAKEGFESQVKTAMKEPMEALTGAKQGFEAKMREIAEPLHAELKIPDNRNLQASAPAMPPVPETLPRGGAIEEASKTEAVPPTTPPIIPNREA